MSSLPAKHQAGQLPVLQLVSEASARDRTFAFAKLSLTDIRAVKARLHVLEQEMLRIQGDRKRLVSQVNRGELELACAKTQDDKWMAEQQRLLDEWRELPKYQTIGRLAHLDETETIIAVATVLDWLQAQLTITGKMSEHQLEAAACDIVALHKDLLLEELVVILRSALRGEYGEMYNRLDVAVIHRWIKTWRTRRIEAAQQRSLTEHANGGLSASRAAEHDPVKQALHGIARVGNLLGDASRHFNANRKALKQPSSNA